jgi:hypothetical protein
MALLAGEDLGLGSTTNPGFWSCLFHQAATGSDALLTACHIDVSPFSVHLYCLFPHLCTSKQVSFVDIDDSEMFIMNPH